MARGRMISKSLSQSRKFARLPDDFSRMLYMLLVAHADREGRVSADAMIVKGLVLTLHPTPLDAVGAALEALGETGLLELYQVDGERYAQVVDFHEHNTPHAREADSEIPAPPTQRQADSGEEQGGEEEEPADEGEPEAPDAGPSAEEEESATQTQGEPEADPGQTQGTPEADLRLSEVEVEVELEVELEGKLKQTNLPRAMLFDFDTLCERSSIRGEARTSQERRFTGLVQEFGADQVHSNVLHALNKASRNPMRYFDRLPLHQTATTSSLAAYQHPDPNERQRAYYEHGLAVLTDGTDLWGNN